MKSAKYLRLVVVEALQALHAKFDFSIEERERDG